MSIAPDGSYTMPDEHGVLRRLPPNPLRPLLDSEADAASIFGPPAALKTRQMPGDPKVIDRLYWTLDGTLEQSVSIVPAVDGPDNTDRPRPLFTARGVHPLGRESVGMGPQSSFLVECTQLSYHYPDAWYETHREHDSAQQQLVPMTEDDRSDDEIEPAGEVYGDDDQPMRLARCCGEERPSGDISSPTVSAKPPARNITLEDYVATVHPWLMSKRDDFVAAIGMDQSQLPANYKLVVDCSMPADILVMTESDWAARLSRKAAMARQ